MRVLVVGAGGVGAAAARIAARREFPTAVVLADLDPDRAARAAAATGDDRVTGTAVDASDPAALRELIRATRATRCSTRPTRGSCCRSSPPACTPA